MGSSSCLSRSGIFKIPEKEPPASPPNPQNLSLCRQEPQTLLVVSAPFPGDLWKEEDNFECCQAMSVCTGGAGEGRCSCRSAARCQGCSWWVLSQWGRRTHLGAKVPWGGPGDEIPA